MKLIIVMMTTCLLQVSAAGFAQKLTYSKKGATLEQIFSEIRKQTGYFVVYAEDKVDKQTKLDVNFKNTDLKDVLDVISKSQDLSYSFNEKNIGLKPKEEPTFLERLADRWASIDVAGRVVDEQGAPLPGATVRVKDGKGATITDSQGRFLIENVSEGATIVISYTGFVNKEITVKANIGTVALALSENPLDQVQIIAYGTTSRRLSTSNAATVTAKEIEQQPVNNPLLALQGRVPGMTISPASGVPGAGITIRVQGRNNLDNSQFGSGSDPLIVIDGVPYMSQNLRTFKGGSTNGASILGSSSNDGNSSVENFGSPLAFINPSDIESITILKDADGTAIYGSRAANGAVLITTKKGKAGLLKADINLQHGLGQVGHKMGLLNSQQYMEMRREAKRNDNAAILTSDYDLRNLWDTTRYTDWQKELIGGTAHFTRFTAGVSGGSNNTQYLISNTYGRETSVFPGNFANTFGSLHFNLSAASSNQRFKIQVGGSYMSNNNKLPGEDYTTYALNLPPVAPALYNSDGTLNWAPDPLTGNSTWFNPLSKQYNLFDTKTNNLISNGNISYRILSGLELKSAFGFTSTTSDQFIAALDQSEKPESVPTRTRKAVFSYNTSRSWIVEPQLTYQKRLNDHSLDVLLGSTFQYQSSDGRAFEAQGQSSDLLLRNMLAGTSLFTSGIDVYEYKYNAVFARLNYRFRERYLINLTARRDGSSRFGSNNQFNNFGAVGIGWLLSEEKLFKNSLPFISFAKLRGSYGTTGNDQIGNYRYLNLFSPFFTGMLYQNVGALNAGDLPNPNLEWEETRKLQAGVDVAFLKDRISFSLNYNRNRTSNSITNVPMPVITGFNTVTTNLPALIQNTGWEFTLSSLNLSRKSLKWTTNLNLTIPHNKLLAFPGLERHNLANSLVIGKSFRTVQIYPFHGIDPLTGTPMMTNKNGNPTSSPDFNTDRTVFVDATVDLYGGIQNSVSYRGFSLDFLFQFAKQTVQDVLRIGTYPGAMSTSNATLLRGNQPLIVLERWQKPGDIGNYPRFSTSGNLAAIGFGDFQYTDGSFVRMKNISFSYLLPGLALRKTGFEQTRVYFNAQNVFTITQYKGLDPETLSVNGIPPLKMITIGVQASF